jgi:hypothetical protein
MKRITLVTVACLLAGSSATVLAATPGASRFAPGHEMTTRNNAAFFAPGQVKQRRGAQSAREISPGDRMNDMRRRR